MDNDELFKHLRKDHYYCHFCETDGSQDYYRFVNKDGNSILIISGHVRNSVPELGKSLLLMGNVSFGKIFTVNGKY
jgi:hypothetical protein